MGRGRRPVETLPDHGINIGADVTKLYLAWLITNRNNNNNIDKENFSFCFSGFLSYVSGEI